MSSRVCAKCGKNTQSGHSRSHSNIATKRKFRPNIQVKHIDGEKVKLCTTCIRSLAKNRA